MFKNLGIQEKVVIRKSAEPRASLIAYLTLQLKKAKESDNLEIQSFAVENSERTIKDPTTMWGDINPLNEKRRCTIKALNKKLYLSEEHAKSEKEYTFQGSDKESVVNQIQEMLDTIKSATPGANTMFYVDKKSKEVKTLII
jgi:hypothetical protein